MARTGTQYDLLISCPGDVEEFIGAIEDAVKRFNSLFGGMHNIWISTKYWKDNSYPQMGDKAQNILNRQLVNKCDMLVAMFWTRFGTQTDRYGSGTEEEIETMIFSGKQVFLYFLDKECAPSKYSSDYENVRKFKEQCKRRGLYREVSDERELSKKFCDHLMLYFQEKLGEGENAFCLNTFRETQNISAIRTHCGGKTSEDAEKVAAIIQKIHFLQKNTLPDRTSDFSGISGTVSDAIIYQYQKELITEFAAEKGFRIEASFWNLGNLRRKVIGGGRVDCVGREEEIRRYKEISNLCKEIKQLKIR